MSSRRRRRAGEDEDEEDQAGRSKDWLVEGVLFLVGLYLIYASNWNWFAIGLGAVLAGSPVLQIPAIRIYINKKTGQQIFSVRADQISDSTIIQNPRDVHIYHAPPTAPQPQPPPRSPPSKTETQELDWDVDDEFTLTEEEDWHDFEFELEDGEELIGTVEADGHVSCYVCGVASFRSFREDESFNPYWSREGVTKTKVSFVAPGSRTYYFVIDLEEDEDVSVSVKLRVKT